MGKSCSWKGAVTEGQMGVAEPEMTGQLMYYSKTDME